MPMGVDEARDDDVTRRIDYSSIIGRQVPADRGDPVVLDKDVRIRHLAEVRVLGQDDPAADEDSVGHRFSPFSLADSAPGPMKPSR
jgi:hypothetical protein